jgi:hypothetical protein
MRKPLVLALAVACLLLPWAAGTALPAESPATESASAQAAPAPLTEGETLEEGAVAFFPVIEYPFPPTPEGVPVVFSFPVKNIGNQTLRILSVYSGCGCTAMSYTENIPPGGEGNITVTLNTMGYGGRAVEKSVTVRSSAANRPETTLTLKGLVEEFAKIIPGMVNLKGAAGEALGQEVVIDPNARRPFEITGVIVEPVERLKADIRKSQGVKPVYVLTVTNLEKNPGRYASRVILTTDSPERPELKVRVHVHLTAPQPSPPAQAAPARRPVPGT